RIEGYQKYTDFVEARLGGTFDFIDRLGRRYERGVSALALLDSYNFSIQSNEIAESQKGTVQQEIKISETIREIQEYGEFLLIAALVPYYVTALIGHVIGEDDIHYVTFVIWTFAFVFAMYRAKEKGRSWKEKVKSVGRALVIAMAGWVALWGFHTLA